MLKLYDKSTVPDLMRKLSDRADNTPSEILSTVAGVIDDIRKGGDSALREYTKRFDKVDVSDFRLSREEIDKAVSKVDPELIKTMEKAADNIRAFHEKQLAQSMCDSRPGIMMGQRVIPLARVGLYVPGGTAAYPSSVLMNAIPAKVAGVKDLVIATPPKADGIHPVVAAAARIAGVDSIITAGGAQVVAAMAYGTESIKRVDKIVGPGNIFVATAKRLCYGAVDIDMIAGPSEVLVIADDSADPVFIA
ncbi:MAG: histidinol dehydrogenase, partial [Clostridia bacterium]|nr:histidinol dehydrogenase [Clostridia bacterium]